jgi:hypothetical protein
MGTMRVLVRTVTLLALCVGVAAPAAALAATAPAVSIAPASGPAGSQFTLTWSGFSQCQNITFTWAGSQLASGSPPSRGSVVTTAPADAKPGTYAINARCGDQTGLTRFTVTVTTTTVSTPLPTTTTTPAPTTTTPPPTTTTTLRPTTTTPRPTTTTATTTSATTPPSTTAGTPTTTPSVTDEPKADGGLTLDHSSIQPGDALSASGRGCEPGHDVTLTADGEQVGTARADDGGAFRAPVQFTRIEPGRHTITASCGVVLTGVVDQAVTSSGDGYSSTLIVLVFFVLAGIVFVRFAY